jgi:hypothetical protein
MNRRLILLIAGLSLACACGVQAQQTPAGAKKPNILVIFGDDIGVTNVSAYSLRLVGYRTPNIDRIAREGTMFTDYYAEQSCTAGRSRAVQKYERRVGGRMTAWARCHRCYRFY